MGRKTARESRGTNNKADNLAVLARTFPLSAAILAKDGSALCSILSSVGIGKVVAVDVEKLAGERYTGGVSCPVHSLLCTVEGTEERVPLIAKVVEVKESNQRRRAIKCRTYHVESQFYAL